jgi:hypothetical protein
LKSRALGKGLDVVREAIQNVSREVWAVYILFVCVGVLVVLVGWRADELGWAADHPYLAGLLDGLTAFCFGVPVGGLVITEINRRSAESAERRIAVRAVITQLDYLDRLAESLSPGDPRSAGGRLRDLAGIARSAMPGAAATAMSSSAGILFMRSGALAVLPRVEEKTAAQLRHVVIADSTWALVGFSIGRLASDVPRLMAAVQPQEPQEPQSEGPSWLDDLIGALQALLGVQLPAHRQWLSEAVKDPPTLVHVASWTESSLLPKKNAAFLLANIQQGGPPATDEERQRIVNAAQERATNELRDELMDLGRQLDALVRLLDAAATCRTALS